MTSVVVTAARPRAGEGSRSSLLDALPHPVVMVDDQDRIVEVNSAAETFFKASSTVLRRYPIAHFVPFGSPLLALIEQVRERAATVRRCRSASRSGAGAERLRAGRERRVSRKASASGLGWGIWAPVVFLVR